VIVQSSDKEVRAASRAGGWGRHIGEGFDRGKGEIPEYGSCAARGNRGGGRCGGNDTVTDWGTTEHYFLLICMHFVQVASNKSSSLRHLNGTFHASLLQFSDIWDNQSTIETIH
jgi:hypothetical protein